MTSLDNISYSEEFGESMAEVREGMRSYNPRDKQRQQIGETVRFLTRFNEQEDLNKHDQQYVETWIKQGQHILNRAIRINDSLCFRNFLSNMNDNEYQAFNRSMGVAVSFDAAIQSSGNLNNSLWRETKLSLNRFLDDAETILSRNGSEYEFQTWFVLLNLIEAIESKGDEPGLLEKYQKIVSKYDENLRSLIDDSDGLHVYAYDLSSQGLIPCSIPAITENDRRGFDTRTMIFDVLGRLRRRESVSESELPSSQPPEKPHLWGISRVWIRTQNNSPSGIIPFYRGINIDYIFQLLFEPDSVDLSAVAVSDADLESLAKIDDDEIQTLLSNILNDNSSLKEYSRVSLNQEREKHHAGGEISDFDIEITVGDNDNSVFVSFPIKSGVEAGSRSVEQLAEANLHQLLRPLTRFDQCAVFPILIAGTSLNLQELLKTLRSQYSLPIKFIDQDLFARILKANGEL